MSDVSTALSAVVPDLAQAPVRHLVCPDVDVDVDVVTSICGVTRRALPDAWRYPLCVVCEDLSTKPCPTCGESHVISPGRQP